MLHTLSCFTPLLLVTAAGAELAVHDANGRLTALAVEGDFLPLQATVRIPLRGWGRSAGLAEARDVKFTRDNGRLSWTARIPIDGDRSYRFEQVLTEADGAVHLELKVTADADVDIEGVFYWLDVPRELFAGGTAEASHANAAATTATMPVDPPPQRHFLRADADRLKLTDATGGNWLELHLDRAVPLVVQDTREWQGTTYSAFLQLAPSLAAGQSTSVHLTLAAGNQPDRSPANLTVDPANVRYRLDGFGGNYCFAIESPVTQYTLEHLRQGWARTEMTPREWEPENDNGSADQTDWATLEAHDTPDSNLRREFLLARQIQDQGIPYVISVWRLPLWLYEDPAKGPDANGHHVPRDRWPELLECLGSYLQYAKRQYGVEPDLFSFNEPDYGVQVRLSPEEHRDIIKALGAHFAKLGLRTRLLLADVTNPRGTHAYAQATADDPEAMRYVGAVAFHSWGGGTPEQYQAWGDLAEKLNLPLLVAELGVDAAAWRTRSYQSFQYALREVRMYQELLLHARPQGTMQWEFTADYSIVDAPQDADGTVRLEPTVRFEFVRQFCNLTPRPAEVLATTSDQAGVLLTAFTNADRTAWTLHLANLGAGRPATVSGLPAGVTRLRAVRTSETERFAELYQVEVKGGTLALELAPQSLLTLTTMP